MKNLIIGSEGFVGKYLCNYLLSKGEYVVKYDIANNPTQDCRFNQLPLDGIDRVYFLGWMVGGSNYLYDPKTQKEQLDWNLKILSNTMDQLINKDFVFVSSQLAENCNTIYGVLKRLGEVWTELNGGRVVRLWNVYGAYEESTIKSHVIADFIHEALETNNISMLTVGDESRQFIHVEDACKALYMSFNHKGIFDASTLKWDTIYDVAKLISKYTGCTLKQGSKYGTSLIVKNKPLIPYFDAKIFLDEGIQKTIKLFKENK